MSVHTFDTWLDGCFIHGPDDFNRRMKTPEADAHDAIPVADVATYFLQFAADPAIVIDRYTDDQLAEGVWYIFGVATTYFAFFRDLPLDVQTRCYQSVENIYVKLFDRICNRHGTAPHVQRHNIDAIDTAVYMIWDMDSIECPARQPAQNLHLTAATYRALQNVLQRCKMSTCHISALHGLGHLTFVDPARAKPPIEAVIRSTKYPDWVRAYARRALTNSIN